MLCKYGHEMILEEVETVGAHQGWVNGGTEIVDASYQTMWVCTHKGCDEVEEYDRDEGDTSDDQEEA